MQIHDNHAKQKQNMLKSGKLKTEINKLRNSGSFMSGSRYFKLCGLKTIY